MKASLKRLFAILMAAAMLFALCTAALAVNDVYEDGTDYEDDTAPGEPEVEVSFPELKKLSLRVSQEVKVKASVKNAGNNAVYEWRSSVEGLVKIRKDQYSPDTAYITGLVPGHTEITLTVIRRDGSSSGFAFIELDVRTGASQVVVSGGGYVSLQEGDNKELSATVSGGSGEYIYDWDTGGPAALSIVDSSGARAEVYAGSSGEGVVFLTVYDALDYSNNDSIQWEFYVEDKPQLEPPTVQLNRGTIDIGAGGTAVLMAMAEGGSGSYEYIWKSDNSGIVNIFPDGSNADLYATGTLLPGINSAQISVKVRDTETGLVSNTASCTVVVTGQNTVYDYLDDMKVGETLSMKKAAEEINSIALVDFGTGISNTASIKFEVAGSSVGSLWFSNGTNINAGTNYSFESFKTMMFCAYAPGAFNTNYYIIDGGNTVSGKLSIGVSGGIDVKNISLNASSLRIPTQSSDYLRLTVTPSDATYTVSWAVEDPNIITLSGSGNQITLKSGKSGGKTTVTATVTDASGKIKSANCDVTVVKEYDPTVYFDTKLSLMLGSDYYGTKLADAISSKYKNAFGSYPSESDTISFSNLGNDRYGKIYLRNGTAVLANRDYTFRDFIDMYFVPAAAGDYIMNFELTHKDNVMRGIITITIQAASLSVSMDPTSIQMSPYSTRYIGLTVSPSSRSYKVKWSSSDSSVATVSGSNATATVVSVSNGTAVITATVTDSQGVEIHRTCTVVVSSSGSTFNPSVSTTLGVPYVGTGTSSAMRSQFQAVYGVALPDTAIIRFSSAGNTDIAMMRLADGSSIRPNTDYTLTQYVAMYTQPVSAGTYSVPYTLSYAGKSLTGTVSVIVNPASISTNIALASLDAYYFGDPLSGSTGGTIFAGSIRNSAGANWSYIRFGSTSSGTGKLYLGKNFTEIKQTDNINPQALSTLYFVPGSETGVFTASYTVYNSSGSVIGTGTLSISRPGMSFSDVPANAYYSEAVTWAVSKGITSGTGGGNFSPDMTVTRGQAVTFLWRAAGQPKAINPVNPFTDVIQGAYYYDAVLWAVQQGITQGTGDNTFSPDLPLNRDQLLTFLCRSNGGYAGGADWSRLAVEWATACGLLDGVPGTFVPNSACPRCDVVYYLWKNYNY